MRIIRWTQRALRRLDSIGAYIARDDPNAAQNVITRIVMSIDMLTTQPALGRNGRIHNTREQILADISYIIVYRVTPHSIDILTILHASQQWPNDF